MDSFKTYLHAQKTKSRTRFKKKKKNHVERDSSDVVMPGNHKTSQNVNSDPGSADAPSSSTFGGKG